MSDYSTLFACHLKDLLARHRQLMQQHNIKHLVVPSGEPIRVYLDDMDYPFKSSFLFRTYVPLTELPFSYVVIGLSGKPKLIYHQPADYWHTLPADPAGFWTSEFDIEVIREADQAAELLPDDEAHTAVLGEPTGITQHWQQAMINPKGLLNAIYWQRAVKSDYEIECLAAANRRAAKSHQAAEAAFRAGKSELEIHLAYLDAAGEHEHQMPYNNIIALNHHSAILHYMQCEAKAPEKSLSYLIDAGLSVNGYHSDITRTHAAEAGEFADLITAMDQMQQDCIASIKTGQCYTDLHISAHHAIAGILKEFQIVDMSVESMVETGVSATFFPHGLGHLIGLQVHDIGGHFADESGELSPPPAAHPFLRTTRNMEPGMVFTIEPGLYFIDMLLARQREGEFKNQFNWSKIESLMPYGGVRIEDDIVVEAGDKVRNLTREAFA